MNVTKLELCTRICRRLNMPIQDVKPVIEAFFDETIQTLAEGYRIEIRGFGAFSAKERKARLGRNPRTGEAVNIPKYKTPVFKFSKEAQNNFELRSK